MIKKCEVLHIDAFSNIPELGNPAGVVLNGDQYSTKEMQQIAKAVGFNETVFICESKEADMKLRYFTPGHETPLCGHATMAALYACYGNSKQDAFVEVETGAGILPMHYDAENKLMTMTQATPRFIAFESDVEALCQSLNIEKQDLDEELPIVYGNTGSWTLLVPVKSEMILDKMIADPQQFPNILKEKPQSSIHPFTRFSDQADFSARHFSSPFSMTKEDPVTGTASGVIGAFAMLNLTFDKKKQTFEVVQGRHVGKLGRVRVHITRENDLLNVQISGTATFVKKIYPEITSVN